MAELRRRADRQIDLMVIGVPAQAAALEKLQLAGCRRAVALDPSSGLAGLFSTVDAKPKRTTALRRLANVR
jgi:hypothetical protein